MKKKSLAETWLAKTVELRDRAHRLENENEELKEIIKTFKVANFNLELKYDALHNTTRMNLFTELTRWSKQYEFTFQFWGEGNNNVFINKAGVEIIMFGGGEKPEDAIKDAINWCIKTNNNIVKDETEIHRCRGCGCRIAAGNDFCGECMCEDDSDI